MAATRWLCGSVSGNEWKHARLRAGKTPASPLDRIEEIDRWQKGCAPTCRRRQAGWASRQGYGCLAHLQGQEEQQPGGLLQGQDRDSKRSSVSNRGTKLRPRWGRRAGGTGFPERGSIRRHPGWERACFARKLSLRGLGARRSLCSDVRSLHGGCRIGIQSPSSQGCHPHRNPPRFAGRRRAARHKQGFEARTEAEHFFTGGKRTFQDP